MKRLKISNCLAVVIDVQMFFLESLESTERKRIETGAAQFGSLLSYLKIPTLFTVEKPLEVKGQIPSTITKFYSESELNILEKNFFDLTEELPIAEKLASFRKTQVLVSGCETDVCVLQSCLGLIALGYEVYLIEDLLFSSTDKVDSAVQRLRAEGAVFLTFKTLFYELLQAVRGSPHRQALEGVYGPLPANLEEI